MGRTETEPTMADVMALAERAWGERGTHTCARWLWCAMDWDEGAVNEATKSKEVWLEQMVIVAEEEAESNPNGLRTIVDELAAVLAGHYSEPDGYDDPWAKPKPKDMSKMRIALALLGEALPQGDYEAVRMTVQNSMPYVGGVDGEDWETTRGDEAILDEVRFILDEQHG